MASLSYNSSMVSCKGNTLLQNGTRFLACVSKALSLQLLKKALRPSMLHVPRATDTPLTSLFPFQQQAIKQAYGYVRFAPHSAGYLYTPQVNLRQWSIDAPQIIWMYPRLERSRSAMGQQAEVLVLCWPTVDLSAWTEDAHRRS